MLICKIFLSLLSVHSVYSAVCDTFNNTQISFIIIEAGLRDGYAKLAIISGCIEETHPAFKGQSVDEITVNGQQIPRLSNGAVKDMRMLRRITFIECAIGEIDVEAFRNLPQVVNIKLANNRIQKLAGETFGRGMPVEDLFLGLNRLRELERFKGVYKLKRLVLSFNLLHNLPEDLLTDCVELEEINLMSNKLKTIPATLFSNNKKLQIINLKYNKFKVLDLQPFVHLQYLGSLYASDNTITNISLHSNFTLKSLDLNYNFLNFLPDSFLQNLNVKELYLSRNPLLCTCISPIKTMLKRCGGKLYEGVNRTEIEFLDCVFPQLLVQGCIEETIDRWATRKFLRKFKESNPSSRIKLFEKTYP